MSYIWVCRDQILIFVLALPSPLKGIQVIGSIFLTANDCLTKLGTTQPTCTSRGFSGALIINKRQTSRMHGKACLSQFLSGVRKCIHIDSKHNICAISPIHICLLTERCQKASHEDTEDQRSDWLLFKWENIVIDRYIGCNLVINTITYRLLKL